MESIYFKFYDVAVLVESADNEVLSYFKKDFSVFLTSTLGARADFSLKVFTQNPPFEKIPKLVSSMQTQNSICYDSEGVRYCDYYGDLLVIIDMKKNTAQLYSNNKLKIHEIGYLLILSRVGKIMDLQGLHKIHAFSVSYKDLAIVCMMPMKGGKSTLLMQFLKDERFKIISDDIPLVNSKGQILPFPIKIGLNHGIENLKIIDPEVNFYTMDRGPYGKKHLICLNGLMGRVESLQKKFDKVILIEAFRYNSQTSILKDAGAFSMFKGLVKHGVIGFGLPMVVEYFWENGVWDFLVKVKIFFRRTFSFGLLLFRAKKMHLYLGKDSEEASKIIMSHIVKYYDEI